MAKRRPTLEERCAKRNHRLLVNLMPHEHIRAELNRLARQVRKDLKNIHANTVAYKKSKEPQDYILYERGLAVEMVCKDVLDILKDAAK